MLIKETNVERLEGKVAIVTGASSGIGAATARLFAKEGAKVIVADLKVEEGRELAEDIKRDGGEATFISLDVTKESDWRDLMSKTIARYGKLNVLVNNAGVSLGKRIPETSLEDWNWVMDVNASGVFLGTKYAIETMKDNGELCSIINRSSVAAMNGEPELPAYCASKGAVRSFTKSAALTCGEAGYKIRVNSIHPGYVHTEMTENEARDLGIPTEEYFEKVGKMHPIGHIGEPNDIAYGDLYLASDESKWVTGSELVIDGGYLAK
jgi:3(or 17)beta-hydroxysteroid dehydrogenase